MEQEELNKKMLGTGVPTEVLPGEVEDTLPAVPTTNVPSRTKVKPSGNICLNCKLRLCMHTNLSLIFLSI